MQVDNRRQEWAQRLQATLLAQDRAALGTLLAEIHAADLADLFSELDASVQQRIIDALTDEDAAALLDELDAEDRSHVLDLLSINRASDILEQMPSDEAADLLSELPTDEADALLHQMKPELARDIAELLRYSEDTAGGLMTKEFVRVAPEETVAEVLTMLRRHHEDAEMIYYLYVLDEDDRLLGIVTLRRLLISDPALDMAEIMAREFVSAPVEMPQDEVAEMVRRHDLLAVPVLNADGHMLGMITVDDIGDVVQEEAADELLELSGSTQEEGARQPWLAWRGWRSGLLALTGSAVAAALIWVSVQPLAGWEDAAALLPLLLVLGITGSSQAAIAIDHAYDTAVERHQLNRVFKRELLAGTMLAFIGGALSGGLGYAVIVRQPLFALAIAFATAAGLWLAAFTGILGALIIHRRGRWLSTTSLTVIVVIALLLAISSYLLLARWMPTVAHHQIP